MCETKGMTRSTSLEGPCHSAVHRTGAGVCRTVDPAPASQAGDGGWGKFGASLGQSARSVCLLHRLQAGQGGPTEIPAGAGWS